MAEVNTKVHLQVKYAMITNIVSINMLKILYEIKEKFESYTKYIYFLCMNQIFKII